MKRCIGSAKPHRTIIRFFARYYDAKEVIHKRISWNRENISKSGPTVKPKMMKNWIFNEKVHRIGKTSQNGFSLILQDITMLNKWFISAFPKIEKISQNLGPKLGQKLWKIESLMKRCIGSERPHRTVFRFTQDITMQQKRLISAFPEIEKISQNLGPKLGPKIMNNWIVNEKVHRIRETSQNHYSLFRKILQWWRSDS